MGKIAPACQPCMSALALRATGFVVQPPHPRQPAINAGGLALHIFMNARVGQYQEALGLHPLDHDPRYFSLLHHAIDPEKAGEAWRTIPAQMDAAEAAGTHRFLRKAAINGLEPDDLIRGEIEGRRRAVNAFNFPPIPQSRDFNELPYRMLTPTGRREAAPDDKLREAIQPSSLPDVQLHIWGSMLRIVPD